MDVDLDLNAYANARVHFDSRKAHASKQAKTEAAAEKALAAAEKKAAVQLSQVLFCISFLYVWLSSCSARHAFCCLSWPHACWPLSR